MLTITKLFIYPIKSLPGISVNTALAKSRGFEFDRRMMLTDSQGGFLTQREFPQMTQFRLSFVEGGILVSHPKHTQDILIKPAKHLSWKAVTVWDDTFQAKVFPETVNKWFSEALGFPVMLNYMDTDTLRPLKMPYNRGHDHVSFADAYPYLLLGEGSMQKLSQLAAEEIAVERFRPNIVFTGAEANAEDYFDEMAIGQASFKALKSCVRCLIPSIDPLTGIAGPEPLKTLSTYRKFMQKIHFGENVMLTGNSCFLSVGDVMTVLSKKNPELV